MIAGEVPDPQIPGLAGQLDAELVEALGYLHRREIIPNDEKLSPQRHEHLVRLAQLGLASTGSSHASPSEGEPWSSNYNGLRVLGYLASTHRFSHYRLSNLILADWLDAQGRETFWTVRYDPLLTSLLSYPAPGPKLAQSLRRFRRMLLVRAPNDPDANGQLLTDPEALDRLVRVATQDAPPVRQDDPRAQERFFRFCWEDAIQDWILRERDRHLVTELQRFVHHDFLTAP
jgi:hypothetical protein